MIDGTLLTLRIERKNTLLINYLQIKKDINVERKVFAHDQNTRFIIDNLTL